MNRRGFLARLLACGAGLALAPALDLFPSVEAASSPVIVLTYRDWFNRIVYEGLRQLEEARRFAPAPTLVPVGLLGQSGLTYQYSVDLIPMRDDADDFDQFSLRILQPAMRSLAHRIESATVVGEMELPLGVDLAVRATSRKSGLSLRGIRSYVPGWDQYAMRFDIITD